MTTAGRTKAAHYPGEALEAIAKVLGDTEDGLSGSETTYILARCKVECIGLVMTKWKRLYSSLAHAQNRGNFGEMVVDIIHKAMKPARRRAKPAESGDMRATLNETWPSALGQ